MLTVMQKLYIYVIEDDPLMAAALKQQICNTGHHVCGISDSYNQAVKDLEAVIPDVVITDIMLKGQKNGIQLARYINRYLQIPVIYHSSVKSDDILTQAAQTCPEAFLQKPVSKAALLNALARINVPV